MAQGLVKLGLLAGAAACGYALYKYYTRKPLRAVRDSLLKVKNEVDDVDDVLEMMNVNVQSKHTKRRLRYKNLPAVVKAAQHAELRLGLLKHNEANEMVVSKVVRDYMSKTVKDGGLGMRQSHVVRDYYVAVTMYFLPKHQATLCKEVMSLTANKLAEAMSFSGLDGSK